MEYSDRSTQVCHVSGVPNILSKVDRVEVSHVFCELFHRVVLNHDGLAVIYCEFGLNT